MPLPRLRLSYVFCLLVLVGGTLLFTLRDTWQPWLWPATGPDAKKAEHAPHAEEDRVKLTPQARANLRLQVKPIQLDTYRQTLQLPGVVVERRGKGDRSVVSPVAGVVRSITALPGDTVQPGGPLLTLRLTSELLHTSQTELFKTVEEIRITAAEKKRLEKIVDVANPIRLRELGYQLERLAAVRKAHRADLALKGLQPEQIDAAEAGQFLREIMIHAPAAVAGNGVPGSQGGQPLLEVEELKVGPGDQVQAGQLLVQLSNHQNLYIEGRAFREDTPLLEKAAAANWPVTASFVEEKNGTWEDLPPVLTILYLANSIDPTSQTFPFYIPLANQYREYRRGDKVYRIWRYRPGQRVELNVRVGERPNVYVLPTGAVVREGAEAYVFRQNGDWFDRRPVHVLHEDSHQVVLSKESSIFPGNVVVQNAAEALQRALKAKASEGAGHGSDHHGHSH